MQNVRRSCDLLPHCISQRFIGYHHPKAFPKEFYTAAASLLYSKNIPLNNICISTQCQFWIENQRIASVASASDCDKHSSYRCEEVKSKLTAGNA
jgi:hypothetical protein